MDRAQRSVFRLRAENKYLRAKRQVFQDFVGDVLSHSRAGDYENIRLTQGDGGLDGIILSEDAVVAVTAPRELTESKLVAKIRSDFDSARATLHQRGVDLKKFIFVHNDEGLTKNVGSALMELRQKESIEVETWTFVRIWRELETLGFEDLIELLGTAPTENEYFHLEIPAIADAIRYLANIQRDATFEESLTIPDVKKLEYNKLSVENAGLIQLGRLQQERVGTYLANTLDVEAGEEIAEGFRNRYANCVEAAIGVNDTFRELWTLAGGDVFSDNTQTVAVAAVMSYYFDSCDIFENVPESP